MLNILINDDMAKIEGEGDLIGTVKDLGVVVCSLFNQISKANSDAGRVFKKAVVALMRDDGPVWTKFDQKPDVVKIQVIDTDELKRQMKEDKS